MASGKPEAIPDRSGNGDPLPLGGFRFWQYQFKYTIFKGRLYLITIDIHRKLNRPGKLAVMPFTIYIVRVFFRFLLLFQTRGENGKRRELCIS
ncbi:hypothetical protein [Acidithiobacillus albertensis]|uniref:hypothetical protein n=1 Tax=Acidithiobacillus albertensis TaxID=119978 RepID=UPI003BFA77A4